MVHQAGLAHKPGFCHFGSVTRNTKTMVVMRKQRIRHIKHLVRKAWYIEVLIYMTVTKSGGHL